MPITLAPNLTLTHLDRALGHWILQLSTGTQTIRMHASATHLRALLELPRDERAEQARQFHQAGPDPDGTMDVRLAEDAWLVGADRAAGTFALRVDGATVNVQPEALQRIIDADDLQERNRLLAAAAGR